MDFRKLSPALALELAELVEEQPVEVFVWAKDAVAAASLTGELGLPSKGASRFFSARLAAPAIDRLSESAAVERIELSGRSNLVAAF